MLMVQPSWYKKLSDTAVRALGCVALLAPQSVLCAAVASQPAYFGQVTSRSGHYDVIGATVRLFEIEV